MGLSLLLASGRYFVAPRPDERWLLRGGGRLDWLLRAVAGVPAQAQIMYSITGENRLTEWEVDWLPGYEGAKPVRIGNGAHDQIQIDVYGELMDALYQAHRGGVASNADEVGFTTGFPRPSRGDLA